MPQGYDPTPAASMLARAWSTGTQIPELPAEIRPRTLSEGYDVQDRLIGELGKEVVGWKLGMGSANVMRKMGIDRPVAGRVLASRSYHSGDTVTVPAGAAITIEFEIGFTLGRNIEPAAATVAPLDAVSATNVTFEVVLSRFVDRRVVGVPSFAADNAAFHALVVGPSLDAKQIDDVIRSVTVSVDGNIAARPLIDGDLIDPVQSLGHLIAHARERGLTLRRGEIVSTGTLTAPFDVKHPNAEIVARFMGSELRMRTHFVEIGRAVVS